MKAIIKICLLLSLIQPGKSLASCDPCITQAVTQAQLAIETALQTLNTGVQTLNSSVEVVNGSIDASSNALSGVIKANDELLKNTVESGTTKLSLQLTKLQKAIASGDATFVQELKTTLSGISKANNALATSIEFGVELSQPSSLMIGRARAPHILNFLKIKNALMLEHTTKFNQWQVQTSGISVAKTTSAKQISLNEDLIELLNEDLVSEENALKLLNLAKFLIVPEPMLEIKAEEALAKGDLAIDNFLKQKKQIELNNHNFSNLIERIIDKTALIETKDWKSDYVLVREIDGKTSINEVYKSETERKLSSDKWLNEVSTKSSANALREQAFQGLLTLELLNKLVEIEEGKLYKEALSE